MSVVAYSIGPSRIETASPWLDVAVMSVVAYSIGPSRIETASPGPDVAAMLVAAYSIEPSRVETALPCQDVEVASDQLANAGYIARVSPWGEISDIDGSG